MPDSLTPVSPGSTESDERLRWVERIAHLMDNQFRLPGTKLRFGLDPLLGLLPVVGDLSSLAISGALLMTMMRHGASGAVLVRMVFNILLDTTIGAIPIIGNLFDFAYKSNERNVALLRRHYVEGRHKGSGKGMLLLIVLGFLLVFGLVAWASYRMLRWVWLYLQDHPLFTS